VLWEAFMGMPEGIYDELGWEDIDEGAGKLYADAPLPPCG